MNKKTTKTKKNQTDIDVVDKGSIVSVGNNNQNTIINNIKKTSNFIIIVLLISLTIIVVSAFYFMNSSKKASTSQPTEPTSTPSATPGLQTIIIDDADIKNVEKIGHWKTIETASSHTEGNTALVSGSYSIIHKLIWHLNLEKEATYEIYTRWLPQGGLTDKAPYVITHTTGRHTKIINQKVTPRSPEGWAFIGVLTLDKDSDIELHAKFGSTGVVSADAIKLIPTDKIPPTPQPYSGTDTGTEGAIIIDNSDMNFSEGKSWNLVISKTAFGHHPHFDSDALYSRTQFDRFRWRNLVTKEQSGHYEIQVRWLYHPSRTDAALYDIYYDNDSGEPHRVNIDQSIKRHAGDWFSLDVILPLDEYSFIELKAGFGSTGQVSADAVRLVPRH